MDLLDNIGVLSQPEGKKLDFTRKDTSGNTTTTGRVETPTAQEVNKRNEVRNIPVRSMSIEISKVWSVVV